MTSPSVGRLPLADRWSFVGLITGPALGIALCIADIVYWAAAGAEMIPRQFHSMLVVVLVGFTVAALIVQCTVRIIRWLRRLSAQLARITGAPGPGATTEEIDARVVQLAGRIAGKITT